MLIRCPHCQNSIELVDDPDFQSIDCPSCGSQFGLVDEDSSINEELVDAVRVRSRKLVSDTSKRIRNLNTTTIWILVLVPLILWAVFSGLSHLGSQHTDLRKKLEGKWVRVDDPAITLSFGLDGALIVDNHGKSEGARMKSTNAYPKKVTLGGQYLVLSFASNGELLIVPGDLPGLGKGRDPVTVETPLVGQYKRVVGMSR